MKFKHGRSESNPSRHNCEGIEDRSNPPHTPTPTSTPTSTSISSPK